METEYIDTQAIEDLTKLESKAVIQSSWQTFRMIQDKFSQETYLIKRVIPEEIPPMNRSARLNILRADTYIGLSEVRSEALKIPVKAVYTHGKGKMGPVTVRRKTLGYTKSKTQTPFDTFGSLRGKRLGADS